MQDDQLVTNPRAIECAAYPLGAFATQFKQASLHGTRVRHLKGQPTFLKQIQKPQEVGIHSYRSRFGFPPYPIIEKQHGPHGRAVSTNANKSASGVADQP
jgi:hypothetical protein